MELTVNLFASFADPGGVGRHSRCFGAALAGHARVIPIEFFRPAYPSDDANLPPPRRWDDAAPGICLAPILSLRTPPGHPRIFYTVSDSSRIPRAVADFLARADQVWVPSAWGRGILAQSGVDPGNIRVVPEGVDCTRFGPPEHETPRSLFRFLSIGKWEERKGIVDLVRTFCRAFRPHDPVELVLHAHNPYVPGLDLRGSLAEVLAGAKSAPIRISDPLPLEGLISLMQTSDAFVLPTRGEGWGLPILEAMACGLPCIVTNYGGHLTFANESSCFLIDVDRMVPVEDPTWTRALDWGEWAQPDLDHLAHLMRHLVEHRDQARAVGRAARCAALQWSWDNAARIALGYLGVGGDDVQLTMVMDTPSTAATA
jgi:glycosyltransferase involved in cell wall biosynthesis